MKKGKWEHVEVCNVTQGKVTWEHVEVCNVTQGKVTWEHVEVCNVTQGKVTWEHVEVCNVTQGKVTWEHVEVCNVTQGKVTWEHVEVCNVTQGKVTWEHVEVCNVTQGKVTWEHVEVCNVTQGKVTWEHVEVCNVTQGKVTWEHVEVCNVTQGKVTWEHVQVCNVTRPYLRLCAAGLTQPSGVAIDWISRNMYFSSLGPGPATISVSRLSGVYRMVLLEDGRNGLKMTHPSSIAVHPTVYPYVSTTDTQICSNNSVHYRLHFGFNFTCFPTNTISMVWLSQNGTALAMLPQITWCRRWRNWCWST